MVEKHAGRATTREDKDFADNMKRLREAKGWSQGELAREITKFGGEGFYQTTISRIEKGERLVRLGEARQIARALQSRVDHLLLPYRELEPLEKLRESYTYARSAQSEINSAMSNYDEVLGDLRKDLQRARSILENREEELPTHSELEELIRMAEGQLEYTVENFADWQEIRREAHERRWGRNSNGEHPEEA